MVEERKEGRSFCDRRKSGVFDLKAGGAIEYPFLRSRNHHK